MGRATPHFWGLRVHVAPLLWTLFQPKNSRETLGRVAVRRGRWAGCPSVGRLATFHKFSLPAPELLHL